MLINYMMNFKNRLLLNMKILLENLWVILISSNFWKNLMVKNLVEKKPKWFFMDLKQVMLKTLPKDSNRNYQAEVLKPNAWLWMITSLKNLKMKKQFIWLLLLVDKENSHPIVNISIKNFSIMMLIFLTLNLQLLD